ncbi:MAG: di-trans,poly-cis-decaprenylcistransferase [Thermoplasmata archaeon]|uniref:Tritrans,polycis-undecaprenyl-diphosphate synthase (geranylgeranyl-diphosphate specific) n=1 Tax=Candidatus Sysuiplasma superficiale TaxID=2823368 RepID=A0A8J8CH36_9ARCH|nr:di-trans,poly-cis-decaprenylcistransferase [Candidatus Sysuiplasma superficiale]MBX8643448.1 di-trans,poly-cis-decaprenylcistransferase [Candidatus Sysuiplasma superficiale]
MTQSRGRKDGISTAAGIAKAIADTAYNAYEKRLLMEVKKYPVPRHVAVIMDGNRRYAAEMELLLNEGHKRGKDKLEEMLDWCLLLDIRVLTVYAFSTENMKRKSEEVDSLMKMFEENFRKVGDDERVHRHRIRIRAIGQTELLPDAVQKAIRYAEERTRDYTDYTYNIAVAYGSRQEILSAIRKIARKATAGEISVDEIDENMISKFLYTDGIPDPDLVLRTSGEERISNFLLWQAAYSELYFSDVYWPTFTLVDFLRAIRSYQLRQRRFGA